MTGTDARAGARLHLTALGVPVVVRIWGSGADRVETLATRAWARCLVPPGEAHGDDPAYVDVVAGEAPPDATVTPGALVGDDPARLMDALSPAVTIAAIGRQAGRLTMLHAGAVADVDGQAVAFVGPSGAGKTTAMSVLARRWGYVTDETVGVADDGVVVPYPKPLSVVVPGAAVKDQVSPDDLGLAGLASRDVVLHRVVLLRRGPAGPPTTTVVPTVRALAALAPETSYLSRLDRPLHRLAELLEAAGGLREVAYEDAAQLPDVVAALLEETT